MDITVKKAARIMYTFNISYSTYSRNRELYITMYDFFNDIGGDLEKQYALYHRVKLFEELFRQRKKYDLVIKLIRDCEFERAENVISLVLTSQE